MAPPRRRGRFKQRPITGSSETATTERSVFFGRFWVGGAALALLVGVAAGAAALALLGALVLLAAGLGWAWNRAALRGVAYARDLSAARVLPGDEITLTIRVTNAKPLPIPALQVEEDLAAALVVLDRPATPSGAPGRQAVRIVAAVGPFERATWRVRLRCPTRGLHTVGPATLRAGDGFGFFACRRTIAGPGPAMSVLVYPRVVALPALGLPPRQPFGDLRGDDRLFRDPSRIVGARDHRPEDPLTTVHWPATARAGRLQVRVEEPSTALHLGVFLNLDTFDRYWEGLDLVTAERGVVLAASVAAWADRARWAVGVAANGIVAGSDQPLRVRPGRGPGQMPRILEGLAKITPYSTVAFPRELRSAATGFPRGSTLLLITARMPEALVATLAVLRDGGHRLVLIPLAECPLPPLRGLVVRRVREEGLDEPPTSAGEREADGAAAVKRAAPG